MYGLRYLYQSSRFDAIHLVRAESRGEPLEICELIKNFQG